MVSKKLIEEKITETIISTIQFQPVESLQRAFTALEDIDTDQISRLDTSSKQEFKTLLETIEATTKLFGSKIGI